MAATSIYILNFFKDITYGFELIRSLLIEEKGDYIKSFLAVDLEKPEAEKHSSELIRWERKCSAYLCCLKEAGFTVPNGYITKFRGNKDINNKIMDGQTIEPSVGIDMECASTYWKWVGEHQADKVFEKYNKYQWI